MKWKKKNPKRISQPSHEIKSYWYIWIILIIIISWILLVFAWWRRNLIRNNNNNSTVINAPDSAPVVQMEIEKRVNSLKYNGTKELSDNSQQKQPQYFQQHQQQQQQHRPYIGNFHVIFSTDCSSFQDWQTLLLFHSATSVNQQQHGPITRIASGCDEEKKKELKELYEKLYPIHFYVHFTPDFRKDGKVIKKNYNYYNKPRGLKHWLQYADPPVQQDAIVALLDPDMIFTRPLSPIMRGQNNNLYDKSIKAEDIMERVVEGRPVGQLYGLGAPWANDMHSKFNRTYVCRDVRDFNGGESSNSSSEGEDSADGGIRSPCLDVDMQFGEQHFAVGPPYIAHRADMMKIARVWTAFVPRVYEKYPYLLAEMYAYSMAAAHLSLPHLQMFHFMVSNIDSGGEGWKHVDSLKSVCMPPQPSSSLVASSGSSSHSDKSYSEGSNRNLSHIKNNIIFHPTEPLPTLVHYCQFYKAGEIGFSKRKTRRDIFSCEAPLLVDPPVGLEKATYQRDKYQSKVPMSRLAAKRNAYMVCVIHHSLNAALIDYKQRMCDPDKQLVNYNKTLNVLAQQQQTS